MVISCHVCIMFQLILDLNKIQTVHGRHLVYLLYMMMILNKTAQGQCATHC